VAEIIYPPTIDWDYMRQRPQQLMLQFAGHGHRVFYCNKKQRAYPCLEEVKKNLFVVHNVDLFLTRFIDRIKASGNPVIVWCSWSLIANTLKDFEPDVVVYDCLDEFEDWLSYEPEMVHVADLIFCSSAHLMNRLTREYENKPAFLLNNGSDFDHFNYWGKNGSMAKPADLPDTSGARIGYIGAWAWWVDTELVKQICCRYPEHQVVVIGPDLGAHLPRECPNFFYLGLKEYDMLPAYLAYMDLCIIPFKTNSTTLATDPIKVYEYLAAGKTVIATELPELTRLQPLVKIAPNRERFLELIQQGLEEENGLLVDRIRFARANSWEKRYRVIEEHLCKEIPNFGRETQPLDLGFLEDGSNYFRLLYPEADVTLSSMPPDVNCDFGPVLIGRSGKSIYRYLLRFNPAGLNRHIKKAMMAVFVDKCEAPDKLKGIEVIKILADWDEPWVTWLTRPPFNPVPEKTVYFNNTLGWLEWDVTWLLRKWIENPETNFGIMLKGEKGLMPFLIRGINRHRHDYYGPKIKVHL